MKINQKNKRLLKQFYQERKIQKTQVLKKYISQSRNLINDLVLLYREYPDIQDYARKLVEFDVEIKKYNKEIALNLKNGERQILELTGQQTLDLVEAQGFTFTISSNFKDSLLRVLESPIENTGFNLSNSIWDNQKREALYKYILRKINAGVQPNEVGNFLESYLIGNANEGQFYKIARVVDTEFQRTYFYGTVENSRNFNRIGNAEFIIRRSLSPAHKHIDICDSLQGTYKLNEPVPITPSHPFCQCLTTRELVIDRKVLDGYTFRELKLVNGKYVDPEFGTTNLML